MSRRELIARAEALGFTVEATAGGHLRLRHPCGALVHAASTPSDCRSWANTEAELRRELRRHGALAAPAGSRDAEGAPAPRQSTKRRPAAAPAPKPRQALPAAPDGLVERTGPDGRRVLEGLLGGRPVRLVRRPIAGDRYLWRVAR